MKSKSVIDVMASLGNEHEHQSVLRKDSDTLSSQHPRGTSSTSGIDPWIRSKYEYKQFATKGPVPDPSELGSIDEAMLMDLVSGDMLSWELNQTLIAHI